MIRAEGLSRAFGAVHAVRALSFDAADGAVTGLLGANGAGKSTTLRMLATVLTPDAGRAEIDGHDLRTEPLAVRRTLGVLPHGAGLYPRLTGRENVRYHGRLAGLSGTALERRIDALAQMLEMGDFVDRRAKGFSQGQRMKVALARALVHDPRTLLLDEPSAGLDVMATRALRGLLARLRDAGHCVLFSSHVMQEVEAVCDAIVIVAGGRVVARGSAGEIRAATGAGSLEDAFVTVTGAPPADDGEGPAS